MEKTPKTAFRLLNDNDIAALSQQRRRQRVRLIMSVGLALAGVALMVLSCFPLIANQATPLLWVYTAEQQGLTQQLHEAGLRLLALGRIEVLPSSFSWICGTSSIVVLWFSHLIYLNRAQPKWLGQALTRNYWTQFYALKPAQVDVSMSTTVAKKSNRPLKGQDPQ